MRRPARAVPVLAVVAAVLLLADVGAAVRLSRDPSLVGVSGDRKAELLAILRWVEEHRGLDLVRDLRVSVLPPAEFTAGIRQGDPDSKDTEAERKAKAQAQADTSFLVGIADRRYDANAVADVYAEGVLGSYDQREHVLAVPDVPLTPFRRQVIAHELVHALDDQHFDLDREPRRLVDESAEAFRALGEGDARDLEDEYVAGMTEADRAAAQAESEGTGPSEERSAVIPDGVLATFGFPYEIGKRFTRALRDRGGNAAVDAAFRTPPVSTEQVIYPERYVAGTAPVVATSRPKPESEDIVTRGVLGDEGLSIFLATYADDAVADGIRGGWAGDRYVSWSVDKKVCVAGVLRMDTEAQTVALLGVFGAWAAKRSEATAIRAPDDGGAPGELRYRACTPP